MTSLKDISAACGVSIATVSKALNDHKDIGKETKERIRQTAREMGYSPNSAAKALKTNKTFNLGVLFSDDGRSGLTHDYFSGILESFKNTAQELGYDITFICGKKNRSGEMTPLEHSRYRGVDGVVIVCADFYDDQVEELVKSEIPLVTIDHIFHNRTCVLSDNVKGIRDLLRFIHEQGHRRIAYIHGADSSVTQNRLSSFHRTARELGVEPSDEYVLEAPYRDTEAAYERTMRLLELGDPPTCICYADDFSALGGMNAIRDRGLEIPRDISVAGYDGIRVAEYLRPRLTTIKQDTDRLGRLAAEQLIELVERPKTAIARQIVVPGQLLAGESVGRMTEMKKGDGNNGEYYL